MKRIMMILLILFSLVGYNCKRMKIEDIAGVPGNNERSEETKMLLDRSSKAFQAFSESRLKRHKVDEILKCILETDSILYKESILIETDLLSIKEAMNNYIIEEKFAFIPENIFISRNKFSGEFQEKFFYTNFDFKSEAELKGEIKLHTSGGFFFPNYAGKMSGTITEKGSVDPVITGGESLVLFVHDYHLDVDESKKNKSVSVRIILPGKNYIKNCFDQYQKLINEIPLIKPFNHIESTLKKYLSQDNLLIKAEEQALHNVPRIDMLLPLLIKGKKMEVEGIIISQDNYKELSSAIIMATSIKIEGTKIEFPAINMMEYSNFYVKKIMELASTEKIQENAMRSIIFQKKELAEIEKYCLDDNCAVYGYLLSDRPGCFIATACYGTPLHEDIQILRNFRDKYLEKNYFGKKFIYVYYKYGPVTAEWIKKSEFRKTIARNLIVKPLVWSVKFFNAY